MCGMATKVKLTIKTNYLPTWGAYEGIRELVQNARDAEVEHNAPVKIDWYNDNLRIENEGCTLPLKALLLGHTTKYGNSNMIGKFGEGLKLGVLALVRAGHDVKIRNGSEVWIPTIEYDDLFQEDVLMFRIETGREDKSRVRVEVGGISKSDWDKFRDCFLFLSTAKRSEVVTGNGTLLLDPKFKGRIYVKGIFVMNSPETNFGYDLKDVELDRDRRMVDSWNLKYHCRSILLSSVNKEPSILFPKFIQMLDLPTLETEGLDEVTANYGVSKSIANDVQVNFQERYGSNAIPVSNLEESKSVEHLGKRGIVVSKPLGAVLAQTFGAKEEILKSLEKEVTRTLSWGDLSTDEQAKLLDVIKVVNEVEPVTLSDVSIVEFRSNLLMGQYNNGKVLISHRCFEQDTVLLTLIHEVAHRKGEDGAFEHVNKVQEIWAQVYRNLRSSFNVLRGYFNSESPD